MLNIYPIRAARLRRTCALAVLAAGLAACGGGGGSAGSEAPVPPINPAPPVSVIDTFFGYVAARIASLTESGEPVEVENVTVTAPENTEPEPFE